MKTGLALRSTVFSPSLIATLATALDGSELHSIWFPSVGRGFDALEMSGVSLGRTQRLLVGTGVMGSSEYDPVKLTARVQTLEAASSGRFLMGLGTGAGTGRSAIRGLLNAVSIFRANYAGSSPPPIFLAALRREMLFAAFRHADGAILNFCSPDYVKRLASADKPKDGFTLSCYIKMFFAEDDAIAKKMLVNEMKVYNSIPQYRAMFKEMGASAEIDALTANSSVSDRLKEISLANPTDSDIKDVVDRFREVGVDLPILYPYVSGDEEYKTAIVERLGSLAAP